MDVDLIVTPGLGDNSYVLSVDGFAAAIDPQRDVGRVLAVAEARGAEVRYVLETHVHNDYVSGAAELRAATGAEIVGPADAGYAFAFRPMAEGDELDLAGIRLVAMATPGHTPEHLSYLLFDEGEGPVAVFSGGSLIVGGAGRTDLLGPERTGELVREQFATMRRFARLSDDVAVLPTHGAGSFCAAPPRSPQRTSTIATERTSNPALVTEDEARFVEQQLGGLPAYPAYYARMAPLNRSGPPVLGDVPSPPRVGADDVAGALAEGAWLVDTRTGDAFARAHVPGSLNVPLEGSFGTYVGWLVPPDAKLLLLVEDDELLQEAATQLFRIGYDSVEGWFDGGVDAWEASGRDVGSYPTVSVDELVVEIHAGDAGEVLDVRQRSEWDAGHLEGSRHLFVADAAVAVGSFDRDRVTTVICASGYRSAMVASLFDRAGVPVRLVARSGVPGVLKRMAG